MVLKRHPVTGRGGILGIFRALSRRPRSIPESRFEEREHEEVAHRQQEPAPDEHHVRFTKAATFVKAVLGADSHELAHMAIAGHIVNSAGSKLMIENIRRLFEEASTSTHFRGREEAAKTAVEKAVLTAIMKTKNPTETTKLLVELRSGLEEPDADIEKLLSAHTDSKLFEIAAKN